MGACKKEINYFNWIDILTEQDIYERAVILWSADIQMVK
jgi:hypothetical protein